MFNLNKSLAKLKSTLQAANLATTKKSDLQSDKITLNATPRRETKSKDEAQKTERQSHRGVVMIKNFPHGFYEKQMFDYFSQFGEVTRLKIVRSRKTGQPRKYGFIEFRFEDVAKIASETMNNYLMFGQIVKCNVIPKEKLNPTIFRNWNKPFMSTVKMHKIAHNKHKTENQEYRMVRKQLKRVHRMKQILAENGINFEPTIVNRPSGLKKSKKEPSTKPRRQSINTDDEVSFNMPRRRRTLRTLMTPKFLKLRAGSRVFKS